MRVRFFDDWSDVYARHLQMLSGSDPFYLGRVGGSDTDMVLDYLNARQSGLLPDDLLQKLSGHFDVIQRYNGYYDKTNNQDKYLQYCDQLIQGYNSTNQSYLVGSLLLTRYLPTTINPVYHVDAGERALACEALIRSVSNGHQEYSFYPYGFVERLLAQPETLINVLGETLTGKRVLVVSPFSESIRHQFARRNEFFPGFNYPDFELITLNTPITYKGLPDEFYPDGDWFETKDRLRDQIASIDFDLALLACGSYAVPLGASIASEQKKQAIYMGGALQLFFGVIGRRYLNKFYTDQINIEKFIRPLEASRYLPYAHIDETTAAEAFGAYF